MDSAEWIKLGTIPVFTGVIGYIINWTGVWMLFHPVRFVGFRMPGLAPIARLLPRKLQEVPGHHARRRRLAGDHPLARGQDGRASPSTRASRSSAARRLLRQLEPEKIAEHILVTAQRDIRDVVERIMQREHPALERPAAAGARGDARSACSSSCRDRARA